VQHAVVACIEIRDPGVSPGVVGVGDGLV